MIQIEKLNKKFGDRTAVKDLSLTVKAGEIFGLLGPNGAGKTTTIRMLTMLTCPTSGKISVNGCDLSCQNHQVRQIIGIVPQHFNLDADLTVWENLELHGRLHHIPRAQRRARIDELLAYVELADRAGERVQRLSGGMKRRLMIARALLHQPGVLFLDEPTVGLDPQVRRRLWDLIRRLAESNLTVVLTTHYIEEAEFLCHRVAFLEKGSLIALDTPAALCQELGSFVVEWYEAEARQTRFFHTREEAARFASSLMVSMTIRRSNLEDVFVEMTGRKVVD